MLKVTSRAKSPRIEPGAASTGVGGADQLAGGDDRFRAFEDGGDQRPPVMNSTSSPKKGFSLCSA